MMYTRISSRLDYDVKYLIWRSQVHALTNEEIYQRFEQIQREYLQICVAGEYAVLLKKFDEWERVLARHIRQGSASGASALTG